MRTVRPVTADDVDTLMAFIRKKEAFDRQMGSFTGELRASPTILRETMFGAQPRASALFLDDPTSGVMGFALYYFRFSSFAGRPSLWLDDLFIDPPRRRRGGGRLLMDVIIELAREAGCTHIGWTADARNDGGVAFYRALGATQASQDGHSITWRLALPSPSRISAKPSADIQRR